MGSGWGASGVGLELVAGGNCDSLVASRESNCGAVNLEEELGLSFSFVCSFGVGLCWVC